MADKDQRTHNYNVNLSRKSNDRRKGKAAQKCRCSWCLSGRVNAGRDRLGRKPVNCEDALQDGLHEQDVLRELALVYDDNDPSSQRDRSLTPDVPLEELIVGQIKKRKGQVHDFEMVPDAARGVVALSDEEEEAVPAVADEWEYVVDDEFGQGSSRSYARVVR